MKLQGRQQRWNQLGSVDPLWAVLSDPAKRSGGWQADEFFATGVQEIGGMMRDVRALGYPRRTDAALDFGCGVGRLTFALADWFDEVTGVDIAPSMLETARRYAPAHGRCRFVLNAGSDLGQFPSETFDLVYSRIVLQHIPAAAARRYIAEFIRVLRPQGIAVFQVPSRLRARSWVSRLGYAVNLFARTKIFRDPMVFEMFGVPRETVEQDLAGAGATLLDARTDDSAAPEWDGFQYFVTK
jgi:SAM-dependent methyltransferase